MCSWPSWRYGGRVGRRLYDLGPFGIAVSALLWPCSIAAGTTVGRWPRSIAAGTTAFWSERVSDKPEVGCGVGTSTTGWAGNDVPFSILKQTEMTSTVQNMSTNQSHHRVAVLEILQANWATSVVAVELN